MLYAAYRAMEYYAKKESQAMEYFAEKAAAKEYVDAYNATCEPQARLIFRPLTGRKAKYRPLSLSYWSLRITCCPATGHWLREEWQWHKESLYDRPLGHVGVAAYSQSSLTVKALGPAQLSDAQRTAMIVRGQTLQKAGRAFHPSIKDNERERRLNGKKPRCTFAEIGQQLAQVPPEEWRRRYPSMREEAAALLLKR